METNVIKKLSDEQIELLRKPLPTEAIKPHPTKNYLSTIKVIYVVERFNEVFGLAGWQTEDVVVEKQDKMVVVHTTFRAPEYGIVKSAFGGNDNPDLGDAYKGACTDALSKIGSYLYVGMDVYKGLESAPVKAAPKAQPAKAAQAEKVSPITNIPASSGAVEIPIKFIKIDKRGQTRGTNPKPMLSGLMAKAQTGGDMWFCFDTKLFPVIEKLEGQTRTCWGKWMTKGFAIEKVGEAPAEMVNDSDMSGDFFEQQPA